MFLNSEVSPLDEEFMLCKVCLEHFDPAKREPKQLPCTHIFCHKCIGKFLVKGRNGKTVSCPLCSESWKYSKGVEASLSTCEHSVKLANLFKHQIAKGRAEIRNSRASHAINGVDSLDVEERKRLVVRVANPLLHPSTKWSGFNWGDDDDDDRNSEYHRDQTFEKKVFVQKNSFKSQKSLMKAPSDLQKLWDQQCKVSSNTNAADVVQNSSFSMHCDTGIKENPIYVADIPDKSFESYSDSQENDENYSPSHADEAEDLNWNYFTQTSTLGSNASGAIVPDSEAGSILNGGTSTNIPQPLTVRSTNFSKLKLSSPSLVKFSPNGHLLIVVDESKTENVHIISLDGKETASFEVPQDIYDISFISCHPSDHDCKVAIATDDGIRIHDPSRSGALKELPIGHVRLLSAFKDGFVAVQDNSLIVCSDPCFSIVLSSIKPTNSTIIDIATCNTPEVFCLLTGCQCLISDRLGNILQTIKIGGSSTTYPDYSARLSVGTACKNITIIDISTQVLEVHKVPMFSGSSMSNRFTLHDLNATSDDKIVSGTLSNDEELILIRGNSIWKHNIKCWN